MFELLHGSLLHLIKGFTFKSSAFTKDTISANYSQQNGNFPSLLSRLSNGENGKGFQTGFAALWRF